MAVITHIKIIELTPNTTVYNLYYENGAFICGHKNRANIEKLKAVLEGYGIEDLIKLPWFLRFEIVKSFSALTNDIYNRIVTREAK